MNKLSKSTWLLIGLLITLTALGITLLVTLPEEYIGFFKFHRFNDFSREILNGENSPEYREYYHFDHSRPFGSVFPFIFIVTGTVVIIVMVSKRRRLSMHSFKRDVSAEILEEEYAEGKISKEELVRKRKILEE